MHNLSRHDKSRSESGLLPVPERLGADAVSVIIPGDERTCRGEN